MQFCLEDAAASSVASRLSLEAETLTAFDGPDAIGRVFQKIEQPQAALVSFRKEDLSVAPSAAP